MHSFVEGVVGGFEGFPVCKTSNIKIASLKKKLSQVISLSCMNDILYMFDSLDISGINVIL